jgi:transcriptional regulator with XRE-family HTH domain
MNSRRQVARAFGDRLREIRGDATVRDFAERIGIDPSEWNGYETNRKLPSFFKLIEICKKTRTSADWLLFGVDSRHANK